MKNIYIVTHIDFDGAVSPFVLQKFIDFFSQLNNEQYNIHVRYCDFYDTQNTINEFIENIQFSENINNNFLLITDLVYLNKHSAQKINELYKSGLNVLYIDHHVDEEIQQINDYYEWVYYSDHKNKCASMQFLLSLMNCFLNKTHMNLNEYFNFLSIKNSDLKDFLSHELNKIYDKSRHLKQLNFFEALFNLKGIYDKNHQVIEQYKKIILQVSNLVWSANLIDHKKINEMQGLDEVLKYWDFCNEYSKLYKNDILNEILELIDTLPDSLNTVKNLNAKFNKRTNFDERIEESMNTITYYKLYDAHENEYNIGVCFGEGDISFVVDGFRNNMKEIFAKQKIKPFELDAYVSFTQVSLSGVPIFHIRPLRYDNPLEFIDLVKKGEEVKTYGTLIGVKGVFDKNVYSEITNLRKSIIQTKDEQQKQKARKDIQILINNELEKIFYKPKKLNLQKTA